jgi:hypothetical protein|tara:strand:+ start:335 stop:487 length:153 start_codon:yes stop_codon:yes gene_type:complete
MDLEILVVDPLQAIQKEAVVHLKVVEVEVLVVVDQEMMLQGLLAVVVDLV